MIRKHMIPVLLCALVLSACTPEIRSHNRKIMHDIKTYDYNQIWDFFTDGQLPSFELADTQQSLDLCLHEDSEDRYITMNGINDEIPYRRCTLSPYPGSTYKPQRFEGRPRPMHRPEDWQ